MYCTANITEQTDRGKSSDLMRKHVGCNPTVKMQNVKNFTLFFSNSDNTDTDSKTAYVREDRTTAKLISEWSETEGKNSATLV